MRTVGAFRPYSIITTVLRKSCTAPSLVLNSHTIIISEHMHKGLSCCTGFSLSCFRGGTVPPIVILHHPITVLYLCTHTHTVSDWKGSGPTAGTVGADLH